MSAADLYKIIGVKRTASITQIKNAYRGKAKKSHPDAGGDKEKFSQLSAAFAVLSDLKARAHYDATGEARRPSISNQDGEAWGMISNILAQMLASDVTLSQCDLVAEMRKAIKEGMTAASNDLAKQERQRARVHTVRGRFVRADAKDNMLESLLDQNVNRLRDVSERTKRVIRTMEKALQFLGSYGFRRDEQTSHVVFMTGSTGSATSAGAR